MPPTFPKFSAALLLYATFNGNMCCQCLGKNFYNSSN